MSEILQVSRYLQVIPRGGDYALYHSLYGGLCLVDEGIHTLVQDLREPRAVEDVLNAAGKYSKTPESEGRVREYLQALLNSFKVRSFFVTPGFDEYTAVAEEQKKRKAQLASGEQVKIIQLVVSNNCNFQCKYCFTNSIYSSPERAVSQVDARNKVMTPELAKQAIEAVINLIKETGRTQMHIQFFGGEPLTNWDVVKFVLEHFKHGEDYGVVIGYSIVTNGSLIDSEVADYFKRYNVPVVVSYDSPKGEDRVLCNGINSVTEIQRGLALLQANGNRIVFNSVLSEETFKYFDEALVDSAEQYGVREIGVLFDLDPEFYGRHESLEIVEQLWRMYKYARAKGIVVTGYWHIVFQQMRGFKAFNQRGFKTCSATGCQFSIEPAGGVFACKGSSGYFGNIFDLENLLKGEKYQKYAMRAFDNAPDCRNCEIEGFCAGLCLGSVEKKYGDIYAIEKNACGVYRELINRLILDLRENEVYKFSFPA